MSLKRQNAISCLAAPFGRGAPLCVFYGKNMSFTYNDEGIRTSKTVDGVVTTYYLEGSRIIAEETAGNVTVYFYDTVGTVLGMRYLPSGTSTWQIYWFEHNLQGDVVAVYDASGTKLVSYTYDAWGNTATIQHATSIPTPVQNNPYRYRGYYFDKDLNLYYLNARYYDQVTGRFISGDKAGIVTATPTGLTDKNLYAYCDNNPVARVDGDGEFWNYVIGGVVGAVAGGVIAAIQGEDAVGIIIGTLAGAASGVVAASGLGLIAQAAISAGISASADIANQSADIIQGQKNINDFDFRSTMDEAALGFITSAAGSLLGKILDKKLLKNYNKYGEYLDKATLKTIQANARKSLNKSYSALIKQSNKLLTKGIRYLNTSQGVSSVVGSVVSFWNVMR